jgi:AcrR family transcriptional regulator
LLLKIEAIFMERGFSELRLVDLARELNTSYTTIYRLAPSKAALIELVLDRWHRRIGAIAWAAVAATEDPIEKLRAWLAVSADAVTARNPVLQIDLANTPAAYELTERYNRYWINVVVHLLNNAARTGRIRKSNFELVGEVWEAAFRRAIAPEVLKRTRTTEAKALRELTSMLLDGIVIAHNEGNNTCR